MPRNCRFSIRLAYVLMLLSLVSLAGIAGCGQDSERVDDATVIVREPGEALLTDDSDDQATP